MAIKVENRASIPVKDLEQQIARVIECLPMEHLRGFGRILVVDRIENPRLTKEQTENLPVLYHPRMPGTASAHGEIALAVLRPSDTAWLKRLMARAQFKAILAQTVLALVAQHHMFTISNRKLKGGAKGSGIERAVREYVERYFKVWRDRQGGFRAKLFKPLLPYLERWQKSARRYSAEQARKKAAQ